MVNIGPHKVTYNSRPLFTAELGINHNGSMEKAYNLIDAAVDAGADIIKFQTHLPDYEMREGHQWQELMRKCSLTVGQHQDLKEYVEKEGKVFMSTAFCREGADFLNELDMVAFKTGSGECNNTPLLLHIARYNKPMIISTGMTTREELFTTLDAVRKINPNIILMNCTSTYPATTSESRLRRIEWLRSTFNLPIGQSDHTPTISTALGAIARGAVMVEKHMTLDRSWDGPDHAASILPHEFRQLVEIGIEIWEGLQDGTEANMGVLDREWEVRRIANHSLTVIVPIKEGEEFTLDNLWMKRPGMGIPAVMLKQVLGKKAVGDLPLNHQLDWSDIAEEEIDLMRCSGG